MMAVEFGFGALWSLRANCRRNGRAGTPAGGWRQQRRECHRGFLVRDPFGAVDVALDRDRNFDGAEPTAKFGSGWIVTTDQLAGGKSVAAIKVVPGGANNSSGALEIAGTLDAGLPFGWSGVMFTPGQTPMAPVNLSSKKELRFYAKGEEGRSYTIMMFTRSAGRLPLMRPFTASAEWKEVVLPIASFQGIDAHDLMGIGFVASGTPGAFRLLIDEVKLR
jgi:complex I intermediate-associated protein 30 (CIA30)